MKSVKAFMKNGPNEELKFFSKGRRTMEIQCQKKQVEK